MRLPAFIELLIEQVAGRAVRWLALLVVCIALAGAALYQAASALLLALEPLFGALQARLLMAAIYVVTLGIIVLTVWLRRRAARRQAQSGAEGLLHAARTMPVGVLIEAALLGFTLSRRIRH